MASTNWVYIKLEPKLWTVGFYSPDGKWHPDSDHSSPEEAVKRVHYLNGGSDESEAINADLLEALRLISKMHISGRDIYAVYDSIKNIALEAINKVEESVK